MQAARLLAIGDMQVRGVAVPEPKPGEILVKLEAAGICGSDRHMFRGEYPTAKPVTQGHEFSGRVVELGAGTGRLAVGTLITCDPNIACGVCPYCRDGKPNLCETLTAIGVFRDGGFAEYVSIPEAQGYALPPALSPVLGAFSEPLACCLHAIDLARIRVGDSVAILGGGVIGLLLVQLVRLAGASTIVLSTRQKPRRDLGEYLGATHTVDPSAVDPIVAIAGPGGIVPGGVDVVIESAGVVETFSQSLALVKRGGSVVIFGVTPQGDRIAVEPYDLLVREIRLVGAWLNPLTHARAAALVASGVLRLEPLVTRTVGLDEVPAVLAASPGLGEVKTMVAFS